MSPNTTIIQAVEQLGYRATVGDVVTQAGLSVNLAQQGLLALATNTGGHPNFVWSYLAGFASTDFSYDLLHCYCHQ